MKCYECGGHYEQKSGLVKLNDRFIGKFSVSSIQYYKCDSCKTMLFSPEALRKIETIRSKILDDTIQKESLNEFISSAEAARILSITRQALHKHRRIRRGFIYQTTFGDKKVYLKRSVELFKKDGDGRFIFIKPTPEISYCVITDTFSEQSPDRLYDEGKGFSEKIYSRVIKSTQKTPRIGQGYAS